MISHSMKSEKGGRRNGVDMLDSFASSAPAINDMFQQAAAPVPGPESIIESVANFLDPKLGQSQPGDQKQEGMIEQFQNVLAEKPKVWAPTEKLNNAETAKNTANNRTEGINKGDDADARMGKIKEMAEDLGREMTGGKDKTQLAAQRDEGGIGRMALGGLGFGMGMMFPALGVAFTAMNVADNINKVNLEGLGTLSSANRETRSQFQSVSLSDRKGRQSSMSDGYGSAPVTPQQYGGQMSSGPKAPSPSLDGQKPGGHFDYLERSSIASTSLNDISAIQLQDMAEKSVAMGGLKGQRMDADQVDQIHKARTRNGVPMTEGNMDKALAMGIPEAAMTGQVMRGPNI